MNIANILKDVPYTISYVLNTIYMYIYRYIIFSNFPEPFLSVLKYYGFTFHPFNSTTNNGNSLIKSVKLQSSVKIRMKSSTDD